MKKFTNLLTKALLVIVFAVACKDDPAPIICYILTLNQTSGGTTSVTTFSYNTANKVTTMISTGGGSTSTTLYTYDAKNNVISSVYTSGSSGETTTYTYDANNRLTGTTMTSGSVVTSTTYTYNAAGQFAGLNSSSGTFSFVSTNTYPNTTTKNYSSSSTTITFGGTVPSTSISTATFEYDAKINPKRYLDRPSLETDNNPTKETYINNGVASIATTTYVYNEQGYPTSSTRISNGTAYTSTGTYICK